MQPCAGKLLINTTPNDPNFNNAVIFIAEYNARGALGLIINQQFERPLNALAEYSHCPSFPLYMGGPVDKEHLYFIHSRADLIPGGTLVSNDIYFGGDFAMAITHISQQRIDERFIKICIGYCGWDAGELEAEIADGGWRLEEGNAELIFSGSFEGT